MRSEAQGVAALRAALRAHGGTISAVLGDGPPREQGPGSPGPAQLAASGPRAAGHEREYELLIEMIYEGSLLHYGSPRVVRTEDPELALLLGDQLYALGLRTLAELGDLHAVAELADVISLVAQANAAQDPKLARAAWKAGALSVGWGASDGRLDVDDRLP